MTSIANSYITGEEKEGGRRGRKERGGEGGGRERILNIDYCLL